MIEDILPRYQEKADGSKVNFTVPFDILNQNYIIVYADDSRLTSGYTVNVGTKTITFATAPEEDTLVTVLRVVPLSWTDDNYGAINSDVISAIITQLVAQVQTLKEEVSRSVKTNPYDEEDGGSMSENFIREMRESLDILEQFKQLAEDLSGMKAEIDQYIEDASEVIVAYINNMVSDSIAEYNQNAAAKTLDLETRASYLESVADETEYVYNNRGRIAYFKQWPSDRL